MSVSKVVPLGRRGKLERKKYQSKKINSYYDIKTYAYSQPPPTPPPPPPSCIQTFRLLSFFSKRKLGDTRQVACKKARG